MKTNFQYFLGDFFGQLTLGLRVILAICLIRIQSNGDYPASSISDSPLGYAPVDKGKGGSNDLSLSLVIIRISLTVTAIGK